MFFDTFYALCKKHDVTPNKALVDCSISRTSVAKWKKGATPNGATLSKIADYFSVTTDHLLSSEQKKGPTDDGERKASDTDIKFALWGTRDIDDDVLDRVKQFARFAQEHEKNK